MRIDATAHPIRQMFGDAHHARAARAHRRGSEEARESRHEHRAERSRQAHHADHAHAAERSREAHYSHHARRSPESRAVRQGLRSIADTAREELRGLLSGTELDADTRREIVGVAKEFRSELRGAYRDASRRGDIDTSAILSRVDAAIDGLLSGLASALGVDEGVPTDPGTQAPEATGEAAPLEATPAPTQPAPAPEAAAPVEDAEPEAGESSLQNHQVLAGAFVQQSVIHGETANGASFTAKARTEILFYYEASATAPNVGALLDSTA